MRKGGGVLSDHMLDRLLRKALYFKTKGKTTIAKQPTKPANKQNTINTKERKNEEKKKKTQTDTKKQIASKETNTKEKQTCKQTKAQQNRHIRHRQIYRQD